MKKSAMKSKNQKKLPSIVLCKSAKKAVQTRKDSDPDAFKKIGKRGGRNWGT